MHIAKCRCKYCVSLECVLLKLFILMIKKELSLYYYYIFNQFQHVWEGNNSRKEQKITTSMQENEAPASPGEILTGKYPNDEILCRKQPAVSLTLSLWGGMLKGSVPRVQEMGGTATLNWGKMRLRRILSGFDKVGS